MSTSLNLKEIESKAFRAAHQDGLWDIYFGGIILSMAIMLNPDEGELFLASRFGLYIFALLISFLIFMGGKIFITTPRLGHVKFGPQRKRRNLTLAIVLGCIVAMHTLLFLGSVLLWRHPEWTARLGIAQMDADMERLLVAIITGMIVGPSMILIATSTSSCAATTSPSSCRWQPSRWSGSGSRST
jgi:energy-coupling factor transporter transmembrane protein EcfT